MSRQQLQAVYAALFAAYGPRNWWPADSSFEVMVGAILTQNTAWTNVERALGRLRQLVGLDAEAILSLPREQLADAIRPAGYFNVKATRLQAFCSAYLAAGGLEGLAELDTAELRHRLLSIKGVGPETADDILLYAFGRSVFVVDAYTRRLFQRLGHLSGSEGYEEIRSGFETALGADAALFNEYHALVVNHAKGVCKTKPRCADCCLLDCCIYNSRGQV